MRQPAVHPAHQSVGEMDHALHDPGTHHQLAGQHEKRNGHKREAVDRVHHPLRQDAEFDPARKKPAQRGQPEGKGQRHAQKGEGEKDKDDNDGHDGFSEGQVSRPPQASRPRCSTECTAASSTAM